MIRITRLEAEILLAMPERGWFRPAKLFGVVDKRPHVLGAALLSLHKKGLLERKWSRAESSARVSFYRRPEAERKR
ncbi:MAG: hypothetical protein GY835_23790 [bacterium]|nr:hypothetical protein [bacterium]